MTSQPTLLIKKNHSQIFLINYCICIWTKFWICICVIFWIYICIKCHLRQIDGPQLAPFIQPNYSQTFLLLINIFRRNNSIVAQKFCKAMKNEQPTSRHVNNTKNECKKSDKIREIWGNPGIGLHIVDMRAKGEALMGGGGKSYESYESEGRGQKLWERRRLY